jgi:hypothetical protein
MLALYLLSVCLANGVLLPIKQSQISTPSICVKVSETKWLQQCFEFDQRSIFMRGKHISQHLASAMTNSRPKPALLLLRPDKALHLIHFSFIDSYDHDRFCTIFYLFQEGSIECFKVTIFFLILQSRLLG